VKTGPDRYPFSATDAIGISWPKVLAKRNGGTKYPYLLLAGVVVVRADLQIVTGRLPFAHAMISQDLRQVFDPGEIFTVGPCAILKHQRGVVPEMARE
jgi:hypothetical protein